MPNAPTPGVAEIPTLVYPELNPPEEGERGLDIVSCLGLFSLPTHKLGKIPMELHRKIITRTNHIPTRSIPSALANNPTNSMLLNTKASKHAIINIAIKHSKTRKRTMQRRETDRRCMLLNSNHRPRREPLLIQKLHDVTRTTLKHRNRRQPTGCIFHSRDTGLLSER